MSTSSFAINQDSIFSTDLEQQARLSMARELVEGITSSDEQKSVEQIVEFFCKTIKERMRPEVVTVFLSTDDRLVRRFIWPPNKNYPKEEYGEGYENKSLINSIFDNSEFENIQNIYQDERINQDIGRMFSEALGHPLHQIWVIPIKIGQRTIGVLRLINKIKETQDGIVFENFTEIDRQLIETTCGFLALAIENARRAKRAKLLESLQHDIKFIRDHDVLLERVLNTALEFFGGFQADILLFEEDDSENAYGYLAGQQMFDTAFVEMKNYPSIDTTKHPFNKITEFPLINLNGYTAVQKVKASLLPHFVEDAQLDPEMPQMVRDLMAQQQISSILLIPIIVQERVIGTLEVEWYTPRKLLPGDLTQARLLGLLVSDAFEKIQEPSRLDEVVEAARRIERDQYSALLHDAKGAQHRVLLDLEDLINNKLLLKKHKNQIAQIYATAQYAHRTMHNVMQDLRDPVLSECGLEKALREYIEHSSKASQIRFQCDESFQVNWLGLQVEFNLLSIGRELITNAIKHGIKGRPEGIIQVVLKDDYNRVTLEVSDNGQLTNLFGTPQTAQLFKSTGVGKTLIQEWADAIGAEVHYARSPDLGGYQATVTWIKPSETE